MLSGLFAQNIQPFIRCESAVASLAQKPGACGRRDYRKVPSLKRSARVLLQNRGYIVALARARWNWS